MDISRMAVISLATWRLSHPLVKENGPLHVFKQMRAKAGILEDDDGFRFAIPDNGGIGEALSCVWCTSVWVGATLVLVDKVAPILNDALAASAVAIVIEETPWQK